MADGYLTAAFLENKGDLPIALPVTKLRRGDWLTLTTLKLQPPMQLQFRDLQLQLVSVQLDTAAGVAALAAATRGLAYVAIFKDYGQGDPVALIPQGSSIDVVTALAAGVSQRDTSAAPLLLSPASPCTYSVVLVNNTTNAELLVTVNGQLRLDLGL